MPDPSLDLDFSRWARARDDYRAGVPAVEVCARHGLARSTFYARAHAERWRRADLAGAAPEEAQGDDFDPSAPRPGAPDLAEAAHQRLAHAVNMGRLREALGWARLAEKLRALAVEEENASWRRLHRVMTADTLDATLARHESPGRAAVEVAESAAVFEETLDSPDTFSESRGGPDASAETALHTPLLGLDAHETAQREGWKADDWSKWAVVRARLAAERPDLPWWTKPTDEDEEEDEEAEPP